MCIRDRLLAGCAAAAEPEPDTCDGPDYLFADDFSGELDCGWALYDRGGRSAAIDNAAMQLAVGLSLIHI